MLYPSVFTMVPTDPFFLRPLPDTPGSRSRMAASCSARVIASTTGRAAESLRSSSFAPASAVRAVTLRPRRPQALQVSAALPTDEQGYKLMRDGIKVRAPRARGRGGEGQEKKNPGAGWSKDEAYPPRAPLLSPVP